MTTVKALTLWQPWATLIAIGAKQIETRSWGVSYRGQLMIRAAKRTPQSNLVLARREPYHSVLVKGGYGRKELPAGVMVATCELVDCVQIESEDQWPDWSELEFGDYALGRWMWILKNIVRLPGHWPARGHQGLWNYELPEPLFRD